MTNFSDTIARATNAHEREMFRMQLDRGRSVMEKVSDLRKIHRGETFRVGNSDCHICGLTYSKHPSLLHYFFLKKLCDGRIVKL